MTDDIPVCIFTVRGAFGHWRKWFTTTSALTYSFPPRTSVIGMIGAILGIPREEIARQFPMSGTRTAVCPLRPIVKDRLPEKWRQSPPRIIRGKFDPAKMDESFQENLEVIRRPHYRIVFSHSDKSVMRDVRERLQQKRWVYPPCLGIMGFLADVVWEGEDVAEEIEVEQADILSVLPLTEAMAQAIDLSETAALLREERIPNEVFSDRTFRHLYLAYVSREAEPLSVRAKKGKLPAFVLKQGQWQGVFFEQVTDGLAIEG